LSDIEKRVLGRVTIVRSTGYTPMPIMDADPVEDPVGPTPGALQGDDLTYDVEIPPCLDRSKPKIEQEAA
jgi:hypothetical protein